MEAQTFDAQAILNKIRGQGQSQGQGQVRSEGVEGEGVEGEGVEGEGVEGEGVEGEGVRIRKELAAAVAVAAAH